MIQLILLAAGSARRFGEDKLMWPLEGKPMILHTLDKLVALREKHGWSITVVTKEGPAADLCSSYPVKIALNPGHSGGISTSVRCGIASLPDDCGAAVFFVADQPWLDPDEIERFIIGFQASGTLCGCVAHNGETGNPCAFSSALFGELLALEGDRGGKRVLLKHPDSCYIHNIADAAQLTDIDTKPG